MIPWLNSLGRSFQCAFAGFGWLLRTQRNARIHLAAAGLVSAAGLWLRISALEWCLITLACGMVLAAEALNTAIETLADRITKEKDEHIRLAKDVGAAGVLIASIAASIIGMAVFLPRLLAACGCR